MPIQRIHHAQITVAPADVPQARAFYTQVMGFTEIPKPESLQGRGGLWLRVGNQELHIGTEDNPPNAATKAHLAYEVNNLAEWRQRLAEAGITPKEAVAIPGYDRFECRDPFGNRVELIQSLKQETITMTQTTWTAIDDYFSGALVPHDNILQQTLQASEAAGLPAHNVAPNQGQFLAILAQSIQARSILEVGTLGGYSAIWLARTLPDDGHLVTLEYNPDYAAVARDNVQRAGLSDRVTVKVGAAVDTLREMVADSDRQFDFIFIDADKQNNKRYFEAALQLSHPGSLIVIDNVVRGGAVIDASSTDARVQGVREVIAAMSTEKRVTATALQTVGSKGYDGFAIARVIHSNGL
jgi:predicted O-methyltransferase YrrM/catechol 2,3-dioxygenase-like lactoylglutathione lyase family enzyme